MGKQRPAECQHLLGPVTSTLGINAFCFHDDPQGDTGIILLMRKTKLCRGRSSTWGHTCWESRAVPCTLGCSALPSLFHPGGALQVGTWTEGRWQGWGQGMMGGHSRASDAEKSTFPP